jgi:hypothetical protein
VSREDLGGGASRSTDPAAGTSSATDVSLREYLMQAIQASRHECQDGLKHLEHSVEASKQAQKEAVDKALASIDKRFDGVNEFRGALTDLSNRMATRDGLDGLADKVIAADAALESRFEALYRRNRDDIEMMQKRLDLREGEDEGTRLTKGTYAAGLAALGTIVGLLIVLANYLTSHA